MELQELLLVVNWELMSTSPWMELAWDGGEG